MVLDGRKLCLSKFGRRPGRQSCLRSHSEDREQGSAKRFICRATARALSQTFGGQFHHVFIWDSGRVSPTSSGATPLARAKSATVMRGTCFFQHGCRSLLDLECYVTASEPDAVSHSEVRFQRRWGRRGIQVRTQENGDAKNAGCAAIHASCFRR